MVASLQTRIDELESELNLTKKRLIVAKTAYHKLAEICQQYNQVNGDLQIALNSISLLHDRLIEELGK